MKKFYLILFLCFMFMGISSVCVNAEYETGHSEYKEINFKYNTGAKLLNRMTPGEVQKELDSVKRKFAGWRVNDMVCAASATYVGKSIFARYNNTKQPVKFAYASTIQNMEENSVVTTGSIGASLSSKKKLNAALELEIRKQIGKVTTHTSTEKVDFNVTIDPGHKISLIVKGDCKVSNGVAKYYILWMCFKKGSWEIIDVMSEYYELCEEVIKG